MLTDQYLWGPATRVYQEGAHSKSYAEVTLSSALTSALAVDTPVTGVAEDGTTEVTGKLMEAAESGAQTIQIQYTTSSKQASYVGCQVGGSSEPVTAGCKYYLYLTVYGMKLPCVYFTDV